ncbi:MAG: molybdenum ABC transporter ATP-binding protein [Lysobacter sp.]|nr:molybdenum ABC transporter ATP-binding protein [Lysobacter sp.]
MQTRTGSLRACWCSPSYCCWRCNGWANGRRYAVTKRADEHIQVRLRVARERFALDVDLRLPARGTTAVFGPSGSGKSTLLRAIAGLEPDAVGDVRIAGQVWQEGEIGLPTHRREVGVVFQHDTLLPHLTVLENLRYGWRRSRAAPALLPQWIERLALAPLLSRHAETLSGGERQRVALARALATGPRWLLLDEPLSALDAQRRADILPYIEAVRREAGIPVLYVTHAMEEVSRLADHLLLLDTGRVIASGPALDVLNRDDLPIALREDAGVVLEARVTHRDAHGLLTLHTQAGILHAHAAQCQTGTRLRVRIQARDVSLALQRHDDTSLLNLLPVTLVSLSDFPGGQLMARLDAAGVTLLARLSHRSVEQLGIHPGMHLWAQIKAVAMMV